VTTVSSVNKANVTTLEALGNSENLHILQKAFIDEQAAQCGYCTSGMIMSSKALLDVNPHPTDKEIRAALAGNLCRCGTHERVIRAVKLAVKGGL
jgi:nicotinate dehydrogenase subunit A